MIRETSIQAASGNRGGFFHGVAASSRHATSWRIQSATPTSPSPRSQAYKTWFLAFIEKLLQGDRAVLRLLSENPFPGEPPRRVRARYFFYQFTTREELREGGNTWKRTFIDDYLPPTSLKSIQYR